MKTKTIITCGALLINIMMQTGKLSAQNDTVKVKHDTLKVEQIQKIVVHDTITKTKKDTPPLRCGEFGVRFLPTATALSFNTANGQVITGSAALNYGYGVMVAANFSKNIGLQAEVDYLDISQTYKDQDLERQIHLNYLNIPVMLSLNTDKTKPVNFNVVVGPQFGVNVGSNVSTNSGTNNADTMHAVIAVKQGDIGLAYGAGFEFALNKQHTFRFDLGFRGMYGLVNMNSTVTGPNTYNVLVDASRKSYGGYAGLTFVW
jgi:hypothetical protein